VTSRAGAITAITTLRWAEQPNCLWVEVETESGAVGLGETFYNAGAVEAIVHDMAAPLLLGGDAEARSMHWRNLFACANFYGYAGAEMRAFSALDTALWDVAGKVLDRPVHALLGGRVRDSIPVYATCANAGAFPDQDAFLTDPAALAADLVDSGFSAMKVWPFDRFAPQIESEAVTGPAGWSAMGPAGSRITAAEVAEGVSVIAAIREEVGPAIDIILEGHSRWDLPSALRILAAVEPYGLLWVEDIIQPDSVADLQRLVRETRVPQAVSERLISRYRYREVLEAAAAHVIMLDVAWTGGISEAARICDLAETYHLPVAPHDCTGPVTALANLHLCAAKGNVMITEIVRGFVDGYYRDVLDIALPIEGGSATFDFGPGLGASLRADFRARPDVSSRTSRAHRTRAN
jgi:L-alanine-DL-glutamate epimerase-like enolase superfamily enzyme